MTGWRIADGADESRPAQPAGDCPPFGLVSQAAARVPFSYPCDLDNANLPFRDGNARNGVRLMRPINRKLACWLCFLGAVWLAGCARKAAKLESGGDFADAVEVESAKPQAAEAPTTPPEVDG